MSNERDADVIGCTSHYEDLDGWLPAGVGIHPRVSARELVVITCELDEVANNV